MQKIEGETGVYRLEDGRFRVRATAKNPHTNKMKQAQRTLAAEATLDDAIAMREQLKVKLKQPPKKKGGARPITTVADFAELWLERKAKGWKASTREAAVYRLGEKILPMLGEIPLDRLSRRDISDWIYDAENQRKKGGQPFSTSTVRGWWRTLRTLLSDAHGWGYLSEDVAARQKPPSTGRESVREERTYSAEQLVELVETARRVQPRRYAEIATLAFTGMRRGELYGLHWDDIDLSSQTVVIRRRVYRGDVATPKTKKGIRSLYIPDPLVSILDEHREDAMANQRPGFEKGIVFPSIHGEYRLGSTIKKPLRLVSEHLDYDIRATPQVLRRTWNTLLLEARVDRITIRAQMGHTDEAMTEHYAGVRHDQKKAAVDGVVVTLFGKSQVDDASTCDSPKVDKAGNSHEH